MFTYIQSSSTLNRRLESFLSGFTNIYFPKAFTFGLLRSAENFPRSANLWKFISRFTEIVLMYRREGNFSDKKKTYFASEQLSTEDCVCTLMKCLSIDHSLALYVFLNACFVFSLPAAVIYISDISPSPKGTFVPQTSEIMLGKMSSMPYVQSYEQR